MSRTIDRLNMELNEARRHGYVPRPMTSTLIKEVVILRARNKALIVERKKLRTALQACRTEAENRWHVEAIVDKALRNKR